MHDKCMTNARPARRKATKITTVQVGSAVAKIYHCCSRGRTFYTVTYYRNGARQRRNFVKLETAKIEARRAAASIQEGRSDIMKMSLADVEQYQSALKILQPLGEPLSAALQDYGKRQPWHPAE
jgi:hypothetical protein